MEHSFLAIQPLRLCRNIKNKALPQMMRDRAALYTRDTHTITRLRHLKRFR